jgi:hypothetical protein
MTRKIAGCTATSTASACVWNQAQVLSTGDIRAVRRVYPRFPALSAGVMPSIHSNFPPGITSSGPGRLDVVAVNDSGNLVHQSFNGSWSGWVNNFGGIFTSGVDVVAMGPNHLSIVGRGTENGCHHVIIDKTGAVPPTWEFLGGPITGSPAVVSMGVGQLDVFVRAAADNQLYQQSFRSNGWSGFIARGGVLTAGIDGVAIPGRIDLVSRNSANKMVHKTFLNGWSDWTDRGGFLQGDPQGGGLLQSGHQRSGAVPAGGRP